jgi:RNA polymerase sigma factor (sigma-70 family)
MPGALPTDGKLARRAAAGDERAFATLCERHAERLYRYIQLRYLSNAEDAADALQQTLIKAWTGMPTRRADADPLGWLFRIARNEAISFRRAARPAGALDDELPQRGELHEQVELRADTRRLLADIAALPEVQREALIMRELSGLGYREIADALMSSPAAARVAVCDARESLRESAVAQTTACGAIRERISDGDRRRLLSRSVRAHMRSCGDCRAYAATLQRRPEQLLALTTALPAALLARALARATSTQARMPALAAGGTSGTLLAKSVLSSTVAKLVALCAVTAGIGVAGAIVINGHGRTPTAATLTHATGSSGTSARESAAARRAGGAQAALTTSSGAALAGDSTPSRGTTTVGSVTPAPATGESALAPAAPVVDLPAEPALGTSVGSLSATSTVAPAAVLGAPGELSTGPSGASSLALPAP